MNVDYIVRQIHERFSDEEPDNPHIRRGRILDLVLDIILSKDTPVRVSVPLEEVPMPPYFGRRMVREIMYGIDWYEPNRPTLESLEDLQRRLREDTIPFEDRPYAERAVKVLRSMAIYDAREEYRTRLATLGVGDAVAPKDEKPTTERVLWGMFQAYGEQLVFLGTAYHKRLDVEEMVEAEERFNDMALRWKEIRGALSRGMARGWEHAVYPSNQVHADYLARMKGERAINAPPLGAE